MGGTQNIRSIPTVREFLLDPDVLGHLEEMQTTYGLPEDRAVEYLTLTRAVLDGVITLDHMPALIAEAFGVDAEKAKKIACDVAGYRLLPLEEYFPGTERQIAAWGGNIANYPSTRIGKEKVTADHYAGRITETLKLTLQPNHIKRLGFLVHSYVKGEKTREATLTFFSRAVTIGGLGLAPEVAEAVMTYVDNDRGRVELVADPSLETFAGDVGEAGTDDEIEKEFGAEVESDTPAVQQEPMAQPQDAISPPTAVQSVANREEPTPNLPEIAPSHELATSTPIAAGSNLPKSPSLPKADQEMEKEIRTHAKQIDKKGLADLSNEERLEEAVKVACAAASPHFAAIGIAESNFSEIARLAIKGVRDPYQTRGILERDFKAQGEPLLALLEAIIKGMDVWNAIPLKPSPVPVVAAVPQSTKEQEVLDKRFAAVAQKIPSVSIEPVLPNALVSAARTKDEELALQAAKIDPKQLETAAEASRPEPARAQLTVGSVPPPKPGEQKMVTDVQYRPRLVGPVEELGTMLPADFRRLSSNPDEAVQKVEDILATLEAGGYDERIRGVQAWRKSPVNSLYLAMANEALQNGIALAEVASRRRNKGEESLSPAEMKAIGALNARIRF